MAWLAVDKNGDEHVYNVKPTRDKVYKFWNVWVDEGSGVYLPKDSIKRLIGRELTWDDEPVEFLSNGYCNE